MRLSIAYLFWATIIGFLIQIFLTLGKTGVGSECTPPLLALWLSFLLITWDPLGRLWGAADVGETCRGEKACWECLAVAVQRSPPPAPAQFLTEPIALRDAVAWLLLLAAQSASLLHPNAFFQKKCSTFVYLHPLTGTAEIFFRVQLLPGISGEGFHCCRPSVFLILQKVRISLSCATGTITPAGGRGEKNYSCRIFASKTS